MLEHIANMDDWWLGRVRWLGSLSANDQERYKQQMKKDWVRHLVAERGLGFPNWEYGECR